MSPPPCVRSGPAQSRSVSPGDGDPDVARHAAGKFDDLGADAIAARLQVVGPELEDILWDPRQRVLPARLLLIDGASLVGTQRIGEPIHLNFRQSVSYRALDHGRSQLDFFFLGFSRRAGEAVDQGTLLSLGGSSEASIFFGLFC